MYLVIDNWEGHTIKALSIVLLVGCFILVGFFAFQWGGRQAKSISEPVCLGNSLQQDARVSQRLDLVVPPLSPLTDSSKGMQHQVLVSPGRGETVRLSEAGGHLQEFFTVPVDAHAITNESGQVIAQRWVSDGVQRDVEQTFNADGEVVQKRKYLNGKLIEEEVF